MIDTIREHYLNGMPRVVSLTFVFSILGNLSMLSASSAGANCGQIVVDPDRVLVFQDADCEGGRKTLAVGEYPHSGNSFKNDWISSIKVGTNVQAVLCKDGDFRGNCDVFPPRGYGSSAYAISHLGDRTVSRIGNDEVSSIKVQPRGTFDCPCDDDEVAVYEHRDFLGRCVVLGIGKYPHSYDYTVTLNDKISSIVVGSEVTACLFQHANYKGTCETFLYPGDNNFGDNKTIKHDEVTSLIVQPRDDSSCCAADDGPILKHIALLPAFPPEGPIPYSGGVRIVNAVIKRIVVKGQPTQDIEVYFLKSGRTDCSSKDNVVPILVPQNEGVELTPAQIKELYGVEEPSAVITFVACVATEDPRPSGLPRSIGLDLWWQRNR